MVESVEQRKRHSLHYVYVFYIIKSIYS